ncbi:MAG: c-type cytochrome [Planctomycetota bacterium]|jgi:mono/diheme cytochrome c family protein
MPDESNQQLTGEGRPIEEHPEAHDVQELHGPILRERIDPEEGYEPVPMWFTALCGALVFWAGWYLAEYGGGGDPEILDPHPSARFPGGGPKEPESLVDLGKKLFTAHCVSCHQQSGKGVPGQYPPLDGSKWVTEHPERAKRILLHGLDGPITVQGETYNGNMPAFGTKLKDRQIAAVLTYIRSAWSNEADDVPTESVAATREATQGRSKSWSAAELSAITVDDWTPPPPEEKQDPQKKEEEKK